MGLAGENTFDIAVGEWVNKHLGNTTGLKRKRLDKGLTHASKEFLRLIWWPYRGNFDDLVPEMMVHEFKGGAEYCVQGCDTGWLEAVEGPSGKRTATYRLVEYWWERWSHLLM